jgi:hypothetical protein
MENYDIDKPFGKKFSENLARFFDQFDLQTMKNLKNYFVDN